MVKDRNPLAYTGRVQARTDMYGETTRTISGTATYVAGVVTVPIKAVKSNSVIILTKGANNASTFIGKPFVTDKTANEGFTITSISPLAATQTADVSDVNWMIFTPEVA